jgi:hypothetical protein
MYEERVTAGHSADTCIVLGGCPDCHSSGRTVSVLLDDTGLSLGLESYASNIDKVTSTFIK